MDLLCFCSVLCLLCLCARLFICALWSPAGKGLTSWLSFVVSTVSLSLSHWPGRVAQSVTCLATDGCLTADPGVASSIPVQSHTFVEIDHKIISTVILLPSAD